MFSPFSSSKSKASEEKEHLTILDERMNRLEEKIDLTNQKLDQILEKLTDNRDFYTNYIKQNHDITEQVIAILQENRKLYLKAFQEVEGKETEALDTTKDLLFSLEKQNRVLKENLESPYLIPRMYNHFWRTTSFKRPANVPLSMLGAGTPLMHQIMREEDLETLPNP